MTDADAEDLPPGWTQHFDDNHQTAYWFNTQTGESSWTRPSSAAAAPVPTTAAVDFEPCDTFAGAKPGHVFTTGSRDRLLSRWFSTERRRNGRARADSAANK